MGAKKLKAIAIRGTKDVNLAHPAELWEMCSRLRKELDANPNVGDWMAVDEDDSFHHNNFAWVMRACAARPSGAPHSKRDGGT